ncbi:MAG: UDP-N-acetylmuramate dehydrogenase [Synergistetes bacterium]|nr:UDP-N-acetylmuramate dehydrogenase [Synergistota bacterium]
MKIERLLTKIKGVVLKGEPLSNHTSIGIGGPADYFIIPEDVEDVRRVIAFCKEAGIEVLFLGQGSNVLISDEGFRGVVLKFVDGRNLQGICFLDQFRVEVQAGVPLKRLINLSQEKGLSGLEFAIGIPGSLGGAIWTNAGANSHAIGSLVEQVTVIQEDGEIKRLCNGDMFFSYRYSNFQEKSWFIWKAVLRLEPSTPAEIAKRIRVFWEKRKRQPFSCQSAGCIFKNPPRDYAGRLIEQAGCKGMVIGGAKVSESHANFIINIGGAKARDVLQLMEIIKEKVKEKFGVELEPEIAIYL